jgi:hypothetical protein
MGPSEIVEIVEDRRSVKSSYSPRSANLIAKSYLNLGITPPTLFIYS